LCQRQKNILNVKEKKYFFFHFLSSSIEFFSPDWPVASILLLITMNSTMNNINHVFMTEEGKRKNKWGLSADSSNVIQAPIELDSRLKFAATAATVKPLLNQIQSNVAAHSQEIEINDSTVSHRLLL